jgi:hypothetical protein
VVGPIASFEHSDLISLNGFVKLVQETSITPALLNIQEEMNALVFNKKLIGPHMERKPQSFPA